MSLPSHPSLNCILSVRNVVIANLVQTDENGQLRKQGARPYPLTGQVPRKTGDPARLPTTFAPGTGSTSLSPQGDKAGSAQSDLSYSD